jgi:hypothetical protein
MKPWTYLLLHHDIKLERPFSGGSGNWGRKKKKKENCGL